MTSITAPGALDSSLDPNAGGTYRDKPIWDLTQIEQNLNRTGYDWNTNNYGELNDGVLNFGFWKNYQELANSYYVSADGKIAFNEAYNADDFSVFNAAQQDVARTAIGLWGDLVSGITFQETKSYEADITYGNTATGGAQAYAYLPFGSTDDQYYQDTYNFEEAGRLGGDVWIDGGVASNFFPLTFSYYATTTMIHETGHALGLSHPGAYNAIGPDGEVLSPTYENQAEYAQDTLQYSIMSYFDGYETGAQFIDFQLLNFAYPSTPMIHDIAAIQAMYGVDTETRAGDTVYGFNTTEVGTAYDFTVDTRPVLSIWDGGGNDTIDVSKFKTDSVIDLNAGAFSSAGGADRFYTLDEINAARVAAGFAPRTQATYDYYQDLIARLGVTSPGFKDNISIAYGATIENATTGRGDDKIIANDVANILDGGAGNDTVSYETATSGVTVSLQPGVVGKGGAAGDTLVKIENLMGSDFNDTLSGNGKDNMLTGGKGDDVLFGRGGADTFVFRTAGASTGDDVIRGFGKDDMIAVSKSLPADTSGFVDVTGKTLVIDSSDGDSITFVGGVGVENGLRLVGQSGSFFYYVAADNTTATMATIAKHGGPADTLGEAAAKTQAMADAAAANGPNDVNLANRADGWAEAAGTNGMFGEKVDFGAAHPDAFSGQNAGTVAAPFAVAHAGGSLDLHADLILV
jgi:Ca2+-binding RTX toxin-like protein